MASNLWATFKSMILATIIAALIWIYAEGQSLATRSMNVSITIVGDPGSGVVIRPEDPNFRGVARVRLEGSARTIDDAANQLGTSIRLAPGMPGVPVEPGENRSLDLRDAISSFFELSGLGSSVADIDPRVVNVRVIGLVSRELPVRVELGSEIALDGDPTAAPSTGMLRIPAEAAKLLPEGAYLTASVPASELERLGDGPQRVSAVVRPPAALASANVSPVLITPESASVNLRVRRQADSFTVASVPVWFSLPPTEDSGKWSVEIFDKFLSDVTVSGPADGVRRVRTGDAPVKALIELTSDDLNRAITTARASFPNLPQGLSARAANPEVRIRITERAGPAGSPSPSTPQPRKP
jgi:hypothetical protein